MANRNLHQLVFQIFCLLTAATPFFYGATPFSVASLLSWSFLFVSFLYLITRAFSRQPLHFPRAALLPALLILGQGWFMVANAKGIYDSGFREMVPILPPFPNAPGTVDLPFSKELMIRFSALFAVFFVAIQVGASRRQCTSIWKPIAVSGVLLALLGIIQRVSGASDIYWGSRQLGAYFFATFRYHGNAGAYLNLIWPLVAACFLSQSLPHTTSTLKEKLTFQFRALGLLICTLSLFLHGSRAASLIAFGMIPFWAGLNRRRLHQYFHIRKHTWIGLGLISLLLIAGLSISLAGQIGHRWMHLLHYPRTLTMRLDVYEITARMIPDAGAWGFGPGSFKWMFPSYVLDNDSVTGFWRYTHQDYLQTLVEWGWIGFCLWALFILIPLGQLLRLVIQNPKTISSQTRLLCRALLLGLTAVGIHALGDFPFQIFSIQLLTFLMLGWITGVAFKNPSQNRKTED